MIEQFEVVNYKGLRNFSLAPMRRVNLVTGPNGVGKSSLAEALWLFHGRYNPSILWNLHVQRRQSMQGSSPLTLLTGGHPVELRGCEDGRNFSARFEYNEIGQPLQRRRTGSPHSGTADAGEEFEAGLANIPPDGVDGINLAILGSFRAEYGRRDPYMEKYQTDIFLGSSGSGFVKPIQPTGRPTGVIVNRDAPFPVDAARVEQFSDVVARGEKRQLLDILRLMQPPIRDIEILSHQGKPSLWADVGDIGLLPLEAVGGGVVRLIGLFVNFFNARGGLIVIDEIENGIHHSALQELWQQVRKLSELLEVQVFTTTHSLECIKAAVAVADKERASSDFVVHQMYQTKDGERGNEAYTDDKLLAALDLGLDIR